MHRPADVKGRESERCPRKAGLWVEQTYGRLVSHTQKAWRPLSLLGALLAVPMVFAPLPAWAQAFTHTQITNIAPPGSSWSPSINSDGTRIAFASAGDLTPGNPGNADGNEEIFLWTQGSGFTQITNTTWGFNGSPSINADGTRIAFSSDRNLTGANGDGSTEIFLWIQGSGILQITNSSVISESPSINAGGTKIALWSRSDPLGTNADANEEIFLWTQGSGFAQITNTTGGVGQATNNPSINADGTRIAFSARVDIVGGGFEDMGEDIFLWISGSGITQITNTSGSGQNLAPHISGDGTRITFTSSRNPDGGPPDGDLEVFLWTSPSTITQITDTTGGNSTCPSINTDGTRIAFCYDGDLTGDNTDLNREIFLWIEGSGFTQITDTTGGFNVSPSINSGGTKIAFDSNRDLVPGGNEDGNEEIFLATATAPPSPDIKANGADGPLTLPVGANLTVTVALDPGSSAGIPADWWALAATPFGWYRYHVATNTWQPGMTVTHQGPLFTLAPYQILNLSGLPVGVYTFYFGVDTLMNGAIDMGQLYYDSVGVTITP